MPDTFTLILIFMLFGILIGAIAAWLVAKYHFQAQFISKEELAKGYIHKELYNKLLEQADISKEDLMEREEEIRILTGRLSSTQQIVFNLEDRLDQQKKEVESLHVQSKMEFENIANRLLEEKSQKFTLQNQQQLGDILLPLREKIKAFEEGIEKRFLEETKDRVSLVKEIEMLRTLNHQLSDDANRLALALKGDNKTQGDWGEMQLEILLEKAGLVKDLHYTAQGSFKDENGRQKRPDFVINLPEGKHLIIDSKVSLVAYEKYYHEEEEAQGEQYKKAHVDSVRKHIKDLSQKNYQNLYQINSPDYLLLFVPIEQAFSLAVKTDSQLFQYALDKNIVIVTTSTLLATMRTVSYIWKQEKQKKNAMEIANQSGLLYDKLCRFVDDLQTIGHRLDQAQDVYHSAMNKLANGKRYSTTLIGRAEKIRELGAKTSRLLPKELLDLSNDPINEEE